MNKKMLSNNKETKKLVLDESLFEAGRKPASPYSTFKNYQKGFNDRTLRGRFTPNFDSDPEVKKLGKIENTAYKDEVKNIKAQAGNDSKKLSKLAKEREDAHRAESTKYYYSADKIAPEEVVKLQGKQLAASHLRMSANDYNKAHGITENKKALKEGAGSGYRIEGELSNINITKINEIKIEEGKVFLGTVEYAIIHVEGTAHLSGIAESYYHGGKVEADVSVNAIEINPNFLDYGYADDYNSIKVEDLNNLLSGRTIKFGSETLGGGWAHVPFDGNVKASADEEPYEVDYIHFEFLREDDIEWVDKVTTGENNYSEYAFYTADGDIDWHTDDEFGYDENSVIKYAQEHDFDKVGKRTVWVDQVGDYVDTDDYEEIIWERKPYKESLTEKRLVETGEWEDSEEGLAWKEHLLKLIKAYTNVKDITIEDIKGFDMYQGPYYFGDGFEFWTDGEDDSALLVHNLGGAEKYHSEWFKLGSRSDFRKLIIGKLEPLKESCALKEDLGKDVVEKEDKKFIVGPRGTFEISSKSKEDLNKDGFGYWHTITFNGEEYSILNNGNSAVAVKETKHLGEKIDYTDEKYLLKPHWYFTTHGVMPGSIPKSVKSVWGSFEADNGTYFATDSIISTKDLEEFEIKEKQPKIEDIPEKVRINIQNWLETPLTEARPRTRKEIVVLQGNYGYGWDDLVSYELTGDANKDAEIYKEIRQDKKDYQANEPQYSHRTVHRFERIEQPLKEDDNINGAFYGRQDIRDIKVEPGYHEWVLKVNGEPYYSFGALDDIVDEFPDAQSFADALANALSDAEELVKNEPNEHHPDFFTTEISPLSFDEYELLNSELLGVYGYYKDVNLPKEVTVEISELDLEKGDLENDEILGQILGDYLSDKYGFCHYGFDYKVFDDKIRCFNIEWDTSESFKNAKALKESLMQEISQAYEELNKRWGRDVRKLVSEFMSEKYPKGFSDFDGDIIYNQKHWEEFEEWCRNKGIDVPQPDNKPFWESKLSESSVVESKETDNVVKSAKHVIDKLENIGETALEVEDVGALKKLRKHIDTVLNKESKK